MAHQKSLPQGEHFPHDADMGIRGIGASKSEAFEQTALGMMSVIVDLQTVTPRVKVRVTCEAPDDELLLVDWLNALVYEMDNRKMVFGRFEVSLHDHQLEGIAWGEPVDRKRHQPAVEVKGATYTELRVYQNPTGNWVAQCVVDV